MVNPEKLATLGEDKKTQTEHNIILDTTIRKQTQIT